MVVLEEVCNGRWRRDQVSTREDPRLEELRDRVLNMGNASEQTRGEGCRGTGGGEGKPRDPCPVGADEGGFRAGRTRCGVSFAGGRPLASDRSCLAGSSERSRAPAVRTSGRFVNSPTSLLSFDSKNLRTTLRMTGKVLGQASCSQRAREAAPTVTASRRRGNTRILARAAAVTKRASPISEPDASAVEKRLPGAEGAPNRVS